MLIYELSDSLTAIHPSEDEAERVSANLLISELIQSVPQLFDRFYRQTGSH